MSYNKLMEVTPELKAELDKRAIEIYADLRHGELPSQSVVRDPDVFLKDEFKQAWTEYTEKNIPAPKSEEVPVKKTRKKV